MTTRSAPQLHLDAWAQQCGMHSSTARWQSATTTVLRSTYSDGTVAALNEVLDELGTVRRWRRGPGDHTLTFWMKWTERPTRRDVGDLRQLLRLVLPVFVRARIVAVPRTDDR